MSKCPRVSSLGLRMNNDTFTISARIRSGLAFCQPHHCSQCGAHMDELALHGLSCCKSPGCHSRHNAMCKWHHPQDSFCCRCAMPDGAPHSESEWWEPPQWSYPSPLEGRAPLDFGMSPVQTLLPLSTFTLPLQGLVLWLSRLRYASQDSIDV